MLIALCVFFVAVAAADKINFRELRYTPLPLGQASVRCDTYSLGATLVDMLLTEVDGELETPQRLHVVARIIQERLNRPSAGKIPSLAGDVLLSMLALDPAKRPTISELLQRPEVKKLSQSASSDAQPLAEPLALRIVSANKALAFGTHKFAQSIKDQPLVGNVPQTAQSSSSSSSSVPNALSPTIAAPSPTHIGDSSSSHSVQQDSQLNAAAELPPLPAPAAIASAKRRAAQKKVAAKSQIDETDEGAKNEKKEAAVLAAAPPGLPAYKPTQELFDAVIALDFTKAELLEPIEGAADTTDRVWRTISSQAEIDRVKSHRSIAATNKESLDTLVTELGDRAVWKVFRYVVAALREKKMSQKPTKGNVLIEQHALAEVEANLVRLDFPLTPDAAVLPYLMNPRLTNPFIYIDRCLPKLTF